MNGEEKIRWAPKVQPRLIQAVYESDAAGLLDDEKVDDLGVRLLLRVRDVARAMAGRVECPRCGEVFDVEWGEPDPDTAVPCPGRCGWSTTRAQFNQSKRNRELNGASGILAIFDRYAADYPRCRSARERLLCIDRLIHAFHWDARLDLPNRSVANNLIEGNHAQVVRFLDALSAVDPAEKDRWRATVEVMWKRRTGKLPNR